MAGGYKDTPIGRIPEEWGVAKLIDVADYINGYAFSPKDWKKKGLPIIRIQNLNDPDSEFNYFDEEIDDIYIIKKGDLLFSWSASIGVYIWNRDKAVLNQHIFKVIPKKEIDKFFLYYSLFLAIEQLKKRVHGSTMKHFKRSELKTTYIPLPPLPEQRKIAEILSTVDKAIQKVDEAIAKTERLKKGLMQELLTKGIGHEKFKDTEIGRIPVEWEVVKLGDLINIMSGQYFSYKEFSDGGVKCLKIDNVGFGEILWDTITFLPEIYLKKYPELVLQAGDVVMALNRPIINGNLKIGLLKKSDVPSLLYQRVGKVIFKENKLNKHFFFFFSMSHYFMNQINKLLVGTDQPYIRTPILLKMKIPLPPLKEQQKIAEILSTVDKSLELERKRKEKLERIKKGLMNDLLTGRIRVRQGGFK